MVPTAVKTFEFINMENILLLLLKCFLLIEKNYVQDPQRVGKKAIPDLKLKSKPFGLLLKQGNMGSVLLEEDTEHIKGTSFHQKL